MAKTRVVYKPRPSQDPRTVDARRNDDPADVGYGDDESQYAPEADTIRPIDETFR